VETIIPTQVRNPFPGLRPFREDEEHLFFGRESQVHAMVDKLSATRFLAVVGTSGSGKSSLVNCGLRPSLHRGLMAKAGSSWRIAQFRPGGNPLRAMARALAQDGLLFSGFDSDTLSLEDIIEASLRMSKLGLSRVYNDARLPEKTNLLIVVDQFEELFRYRESESQFATDPKQRSLESTAFVNLLLDPRTQPYLPIYVVLTMRSDFLGSCAEFAGLPEAVNEGEYLIPRLTRDERRAAIEGPVSVGGAEITPVLLTRLVNDVGDNPDQLSILQHALNRTWACWENDDGARGPLDLRHYETIGTMSHALDQHAERAYRELHGEHAQKICEKIFKALTDKRTDPGVRRPTRFGVLCRLAGATSEEVTEVLNVFRKPSRSFVMPPLHEDLDEHTVIDISHESLMRIWERLVAWTDEEVQSAQLYRRLSETAALHLAGKAGLWNDPDLQSALDWKEREKPTEEWAELYGGHFDHAMAFLSASQIHRDKELQDVEDRRRRELQQAQDLAAERQKHIDEQAQATVKLRRWLGALAVVAVGLFLVGILAVRESITARNALKGKNDALKIAEISKQQYYAASLADQKAEVLAEEREQSAEMSDREMRLEGLRVRDANLMNQSELETMADSLLEYSSGQQAAMWRRSKGDFLMNQGDYTDALDLLSKVIEASPNDSSARTERGYLLILLNRPTDALQDFHYIRDNVDRGFPINDLNLTIAAAAVGDYASAQRYSRDAVTDMRHRDSDSGGEVLIPPDITRATGRVTLAASGPTFVTAIYYEQASLEAYIGDLAGFRAALQRADLSARALSPVAAKDAYFVAMTWAWLHLGVRCPDSAARCKDYSAFASQAALWERAGYKDWAVCYYERFEDKAKKWPDRRYTDIAQWVQQSRSALGPSFSCQNLKDEEPDVSALEVAAREAKARKDFAKARSLYDQALAKAGDVEKTRLILLKADVLLETGRAETESSKNQDAIADAAKTRANKLEADEKAEEERQQNLLRKARIDKLEADEKVEEGRQQNLQKSGSNDAASWAAAKSRIDEQYALKIAAARKEQTAAEQSSLRHRREANSAFLELKRDCTHILKTNPESGTAYYYRALANDWLDSGSLQPVLSDIHQSLRLDPDNQAALYLLDELVPNEPKEQNRFLEDNRRSLDHLYKVSPYQARVVIHQAKLAQQQKHYVDALQLADIAINMKPGDFSYYAVRAEIQRLLGYDEAQVQRNLAEGYRKAGYILRTRDSANPEYADLWEWSARSTLAKSHGGDEVRCDPEVKVCSITKTVEVNGELIFGEILALLQQSENHKTVEVRIDKGAEDGVVVGTQGDAWSLRSKSEDGHERPIAKLGTIEVLSTEPHSALVRIQVDQPEGDGMVRKQDVVHIKARVPKLADRSSLWSVAKYNVSVIDSHNKVVLDYDTLYGDETPELDAKLFQRIIQDIHDAAPLFNVRLEPIKQGKFANQTLSHAMEVASTEDLKDFIAYLLKYPGDILGQRLEVYKLYAAWAYIGTPTE
jgi:hypothetical protein